MPHILNELTLSSQLMRNFSRQKMHYDAFVLMDSALSHCFASSDNTILILPKLEEPFEVINGVS